MKRRLIYILTVILSASVFSACNQEMIQDHAYGYLGVCVNNDLSEDVVVKAASEELVFSLEVLDMSGNSVKTVDNHNTVTASNPIKLATGDYTLLAASGENLNAAFENPYYEGRSGTFTINPDKTTTVNVDCRLANTVVSMEFPKDFSGFTEYEVAVTNGTGDELVFSNNPEADNALEAGFDAKAYFAVTGNLILKIHLKNQSGYSYDDTRIFTGVKANQHYHFKFTKGESEELGGGFVLKIELDRSWEDTDHEVILDFNQENKPAVVTNDSFPVVSGEPVLVGVDSDPTEEKSLTFEAPEGLDELWMSHDIDMLTDLGVSGTVDLLGEPQDVMTILRNAGVTVTENQTRSSAPTSVSVNVAGLLSSLEVGNYDIDFTLIDSRGRYDVFNLKITVMSDVDAQAVNARTGWASFARLEGCFFESAKKDEVTFQYKKASDSEWIELDPSHKTVDMSSSPMTYSMMVYGLEPATDYVFRAVSSDDKDTEQMKFSTAAAGTIHNLSFDSWTDSDKYPNASGYDIWDSANSSGAAITTKPTSDAVSGKAARLESVKYMGMMAAGNIFTGQFAGLAGLGAKLDWGVPFNARPIAMRGYYKYAPKTIDMAKAPYTDYKGQIDQSQILVFLTDWTGTFRINTSSKDFVDLDNDPGIIALGQQNTSKTDSEYVSFTLPLVYRDAKRIPNYIVIAAASSRYGDYFTGGVGSVLYVDEFELIYDPAELTEEEFNTVFSKVSPF